MSETLRGFPPSTGAAPRALVLGSMPGRASLAAGEYYAHPRNAFWPLMQALFAVPREAPYAQRLGALHAAGIGLWDVLAACERVGSLDSAIVPASRRFNALPALVEAAPGLCVIALNGGEAARLFDRHLRPALPATRALRVLRLPSTSPAHAALDLAAKTRAWQALAEALAETPACA